MTAWLESLAPEYHSEPAELLGARGMVTVWDEHGRYVGCLGADAWKFLLTTSERRLDADA